MTKEMNLSDTHCIDEWEMNNPGYLFEHVFYYENTHFVRKVIGRVPVRKKTFHNGSESYGDSNKRVRWDAKGHCYCGNDNHRNRDYDIHF